jgi:hypothetical protein
MERGRRDPEKARTYGAHKAGVMTGIGLEDDLSTLGPLIPAGRGDRFRPPFMDPTGEKLLLGELSMVRALNF